MRCLLHRFALILLLLASAFSAEAATHNWTGSTDGNFGTSSNWNTAPNFALYNDYVFSNNTNTTIALGAVRNFSSLTFQAGAGAYNFTGANVYFGYPGSGTAHVTVEAGVTNHITFSQTGSPNYWGFGETVVNGSGTVAFTNHSANASLNLNTQIYTFGGTRTISFDGAGEINLGAGGVVNRRNGGLLTIQKDGSGVLNSNVASTFVGATSFVINGGTVNINGVTTLPDTAPFTLKNGTVNFNAPIGVGEVVGQTTLGGAAGNAVIGGTGWASLHGTLAAITYDASNGAGPATISVAKFGLGANSINRQFQIGDGAAAVDLAISSQLSDSNGLLKTGAGTMSLTNVTSNYLGRTFISEGVIEVALLAHVGAASSLGQPATVNAGTIDLGSTTNTGTLRYIGSDNSLSNRVLNLAGTTGGATLDASGAGTISFTSAFTAAGAGSKTLTLTGSNAANNTLSGAIVNNSLLNTTALEKSGAGTWVLSANNSFTGGATITAGKLLVTNTTGSGLGSGPVLVSGGTLGGTGFIGAPVTVGASGNLAPGLSPGVLTINNDLSLSNTSGLFFELAAPNANGYGSADGGSDRIDVLGDLTLDGILNLSALVGFDPTLGSVWRLFNYQGDLFDQQLQIGSRPALASGLGFAVDTSTAGQVNLIITLMPVPEPSSLLLAGLGAVGLAGSLRRRSRGKPPRAAP